MIKIAFRKLVRKLRFKLSSTNNRLFVGYYKYLYKPRKGSISEFLNTYSKSKLNNFTVIQIGANDGITHDPIHKFIKRDKWNGVLLEPQSYVYENQLKRIYERDKGIHAVCVAIGEKDGTTHLYKIGFCNMRWATGSASFQRENVEKAFSSGMVQENCEKYKIEIPSDAEHIIAEEVRVISPETLLKEYKITTIDLLQIDVEGFDFEVIKIFDIAKSQPRAIIFEHSHLSESDMKQCYKLFEENNYAFRKFGANTLAMLKPLGDFDRYFNNEKTS